MGPLQPRAPAFLLVAALCSGGCGQHTAGAFGSPCSAAADCATGLLCIGGSCTLACSSDNDCLEHQHCQSGVCSAAPCSSTTCCGSDVDCNHATDSVSCLDISASTSCQGVALRTRCVSGQCIQGQEDDDSACTGLQHACTDNLRAVACSDAVDQPVAACPAQCGGDGDCIGGLVCATGACVTASCIGDSCGLSSCGSGCQCGQGICCSASAAHCCQQNPDCPGALACDSTTHSCFETCQDGDSSRCAQSTDVCFGNQCCTPQCGGKCAGADDGCGGLCTTPACPTSCDLPWGGSLADGDSVTAYAQALPTGPCSAVAETRACTGGTLSGSATEQSCTDGCSATLWGDVASGYSATAYSTSTPTGQCSAVAQTRTCTAGTLSGAFTNTSCADGCGSGTHCWSGSASGCCASLAAAVDGHVSVLNYTTQPLDGSATYTCNQGTWSSPTSKSCDVIWGQTAAARSTGSQDVYFAFTGSASEPQGAGAWCLLSQGTVTGFHNCGGSIHPCSWNAATNCYACEGWSQGCS